MSRSIIAGDRPEKCFLCELARYGKLAEKYPGIEKGEGPIEEHHIFFGPLRSKSEHYGLKVHLCAYHHRIGPYAAHNNAEEADALKAIAQKEYERRYGHASFMQEFGRNYLPPEEWEL